MPISKIRGEKERMEAGKEGRKKETKINYLNERPHLNKELNS